jgi:large subunit ribosomal protein L23
MNFNYVLKKPLVTEKSTFGMNELNRYAFEVDPRASKEQIKSAVEDLYKVKVVKINTQVRKERARRMKYGVVEGKRWKMAVVRLQEGQTIDLFS